MSVGFLRTKLWSARTLLEERMQSNTDRGSGLCGCPSDRKATGEVGLVAFVSSMAPGFYGATRDSLDRE
jgi:hypothetical protein